MTSQMLVRLLLHFFPKYSIWFSVLFFQRNSEYIRRALSITLFNIVALRLPMPRSRSRPGRATRVGSGNAQTAPCMLGTCEATCEAAREARTEWELLTTRGAIHSSQAYA